MLIPVVEGLDRVFYRFRAYGFKSWCCGRTPVSTDVYIYIKRERIIARKVDTAKEHAFVEKLVALR